MRPIRFDLNIYSKVLACVRRKGDPRVREKIADRKVSSNDLS